MKAFSELLDRLVLTPSRNGKLTLLKDYFAETPDPAGGASLAFGRRWGAWSLAGEVRGLLTLNNPIHGGVHSTLYRVTGALVPCGHWRWLLGCAVLEAGALGAGALAARGGRVAPPPLRDAPLRPRHQGERARVVGDGVGVVAVERALLLVVDGRVVVRVGDGDHVLRVVAAVVAEARVGVAVVRGAEALGVERRVARRLDGLDVREERQLELREEPEVEARVAAAVVGAHDANSARMRERT